jgi:hypothetical protein
MVDGSARRPRCGHGTKGITMHWTGKPTTDTTAGALLETGWALTDAYGHRIRLPEAIEAQPPRPPAEAA